MPQYDLSSADAIAAAAELAHVYAGRAPSQGGYNAAWLHGYASALSDCAEQLEPRQKLMDAIIGYMGERHDSAELYAVLHDALAMSDQEIRSLGFDLPQCAEPKPQTHKTKRRKPSHER